jgi:hypothetical protein
MPVFILALHYDATFHLSVHTLNTLYTTAVPPLLRSVPPAIAERKAIPIAGREYQLVPLIPHFTTHGAFFAS